MADRRRRSPEGSRRIKGKEPARSAYEEPPRMPGYEQSRMRAGAEEVVYSSSSSSSSYIDISRSFPPKKFGIRTFFTAPSERRRLRRRRSSRLFKIANSSTSSVNDDLAYGTGFIKRPKRRGVRSRKGREFGGDRYSDRESNRIPRERREETGRLPLGRAQTDAEILAIGAGLAKLARDQNKQDLRNARNDSQPNLVARTSNSALNQGPSRGLVNSRPSLGSDTVDEDGWESASESEESIDSRLAFGGESKGGWGFFGRKKHQPLSRKNTIVDPRLFGPQNTLHGVVTEPVGFSEVTPWISTDDFGQRSQFSEGPVTGPSHSGSQASLQRVYPISTSNPAEFDARASSVISRPEAMVVSRPGPIPIQQPQPIAPISQSVYGRSESGTVSKQNRESVSSGRGKSLAEAALVGVAGAAVGTAIASSRDDRKRREDEEPDERNRIRRRDSERESRDDRRRDKRSSPDRDERREKRREKDDSSRVTVDDSRRDKRRERRKDETREERDERRERRRDEPRDEKDERREKRREERRGERGDDRVEARRTKSETAVPTTVIDPFQYQVPDDAFPTPTVEPQRRIDLVPEVHYVTVEREPDFSRIPPIRDARTPDFMKMHREEEPKYFESEQLKRESEFRDRALHEAEEIYEETSHSTAPIAAAAFGAAVAAVHHADFEHQSKSDKRREERRSGEKRRDYDDYDSKPRDKKLEKERDPIQEEADRAYREIVMARKIASQVIRSRTPSPDRSVTEKYTETEEEPIVRIVTPPGMEDHKKTGPYDAPNADFKLDHVLEDPMDLRTFRISPTNVVRVDAEGPYLKRDPDADRPRPFLNLVRPTPVPSPMPEKQAARSEPASPSKSTNWEEPKRSSASDVQPKDEVVTSPTTSAVFKAVTWGENETKHYEVESPSEHRDEFVSKSDIQAHEAEEPKHTSKSKPKSKGWGAIAAALGAGVGAAAATSSSETSKTSKSREDEKKDAPDEYRGVVVEPESEPRSSGQRNGPPIGPKPSSTSEPSRVPGAFNDDLDFTATVAAGLQDSGFDPNIVIDDPSFRRRDSPPGSNDYGPYRAPFAETVSDLGTIPSEVSGARSAQGFVIGEVATTPSDWRSVSPPKDDETPTKLSKKEQKKRDRERRRSGDVTPLEESSAAREVVEEPESYFEPPLSKKEQKKRDKLARQSSQGDDITPSVADEIVEEPESYFETPKKSKKKSKKGSSSVDDYVEDTSRDSRKVSVAVDAFDDLRNDDDEWADTKKSKKKSKRDSDRYDSPARSVPSSEIASELERSSSKKSKDKSKRNSEQYEPDPTEISLPPSTPSETSRDGDFDDVRGTRKSSTRDSGIFNSADRGESRSVVSADTSRYDDDEPRKSKKKSRSSTKDDYDDSRSVVSVPASDDYEDSKRSKKKDKDKEKDKKSGAGFFGLFGSKSEVNAKDESPKGSKDDFEESKKKKKSKRSSVPDSSSIYGDMGAQSVRDLSRSVSNGNGTKNGSYPDDLEDQNGDDPGEKKKTRSRSESSSSKKDSFLGNAGTLGAGVGIAGAAVAIAAQQYQQSKAANAHSSQTAEHEQPRSSPSSTLPHEIFDSEITERQFRPSIDPQYGDLLPLPPSNPVSPNVDPIDDLPELPDSRPDTPEPERISREKSMSAVRKNQETPMKSPSQSAVPLNFLMRNRSQPSSPGLVRSSPLQSPATLNQDSLSFPRHRPRPTSWDSSKEYKPLYLVESNRRGSSAQVMEPEEELPALPPSQGTSRSSSQLDFAELAKDPLSIDTELASSKRYEELLGSEQSTPKAAVMTRDRRDSDDSFHSARSTEEPSLPSQSDRRSSSPEPKSHFREHFAEAAAAAGLVSTLGYFASSPTHPTTKESFLEELPSVARQPSPVDPMTKDRSSYLLQSSPMSKMFEDIEAVHQDVDSPSGKQISSLTSDEAMKSIQERETSDIFGSPKHVPEDVERNREWAKDTHSSSPHGGLTHQDVTREAPESQAKDLPELETAATPNEDERGPANEFAFTESKNDKKKNKGLARSSTQDDFSILESSKDVPKETSVPADPEPAADEFLVTKSTKDKKKDKKKGKSAATWEPEESESVPQQIEEPAQETTRDLSEDIATPANVEPVDDFFTAKSQKDKKKNKRKSIPTWESEESESTSRQIEEPAPETSRAISEDVSTPVNTDPADDFSTAKSKRDKKKDKKKGKSISAWEPEDKTVQQSQEPESEPIVEQTQYLPEETQSSSAIEQTDQFSTPKSKKDKKKDKKRAKSASSWDPEENIASHSLPESTIEESRGPVEETSPAEVEGLEEFSFAKSKKDKKKDKKRSKSTSAVGSEKDESEAQIHDTSQELVEEPSSILNETSVPETGVTKQHDKLATTEDPKDRESIAEPISSYNPSDIPSDAYETRIHDNLLPSDRKPATSEVLFQDKAHSKPTSQEIQPETTEDVAREHPAANDFTAFESKKDKKKKGKSPMAWEQADEAATTAESILLEAQPESTRDIPEAAPPADEFVFTESKKSKKDKKKRGKSVTAWEPEEEPAPGTVAQEIDDTQKFEEATFKKGKRKNRKSSSFVPEDSLASTLQQEPGESLVTQDDTLGRIDGLKTEESQLPPESSTTAERATTTELENILNEPESLSSKPTPMGGPGAWPITPVTPWTGGEVPESLSKEYFPTAAATRSPSTSEMPEDAQSKSYLPSTGAVVAAGAALLGLESLNEKSFVLSKDSAKDATTSNSLDFNEPSVSQADSKPTPDGLTAGYDDDQLSLAKRLQEEFSSGSKKSKKDKKRQSLPPTPAREPSRSRTVEELPESHPRARSLSIGPDTTTSGSIKNTYSENQVELARQLKEEFGSSSKKGKKDKKKRQGISRSSTQDDIGFDREVEESQVTVPDVSRDTQELEIPETAPKGDGFAAGYQEDQLSLARQLQAEFGKKSKKDKKRRSTSQTPQDQEPRNDYFGESSQAPVANILEQEREAPNLESTPATENTRDGLAAGYKEEQLELARQLKEEFGSGSKKSKKDKKDKKRGSLLRSNTEDDFSSDAQPRDETGGNFETQEPETAETGPSNEPEDEFAFITKKSKKDKKRKKGASLLPDAQDDDLPSDNIPRAADDEAKFQDFDAPETKQSEEGLSEYANTEPQGDLTFTTKKSKKDKKGKKRGSLLLTPAEDDLPSKPLLEDQGENRDVDVPPQADSALSSEPVFAGPEDGFASFTKKSKKTKKRDSLLRTSTEEDNSSDNFGKEVEALHSARDLESGDIDLKPAQVPPEDDWSVPVKTSKKDKKKRQSTITREESFDQRTVEPDSEQPREELSTTDIPAVEAVGEPSDDFAFSLKRSKKDKKKRGSLLRSSTFDETPEQQAEDVKAQPETENRGLRDDAGTLAIPLAADQDDGFEYSSKKSKKDKKYRKSLQQTSMAEDQAKEVEESPKQEDTLLTTATGDIQPSNLEIGNRAPESTTRETTCFENKLLSQCSVLKTEDGAPKSTARAATFGDRSLMEPGEDESTNGPPDIFHDFTFTTEKSKKDKKQKDSTKDDSGEASGFTTPLNPITAPRSTIETSSPTDREEIVATDKPLERDLDSFTASASEAKIEVPADEWSSFLMKKSKKDKKRKSSSRIAPQAPSNPLAPILAPEVATEERALPTDNVLEQDKTTEEPIIQKPERPTTITAEDNIEEPADGWASFTTKISKRDKKKSRSLSRTPSEGTSGILTPKNPILERETSIGDRSLPIEGVPSASDEPDELTGVTAKGGIEEPADEWASFTTKKPKKDKKKRKSGLSSTVETVEEIQNFEPGEPLVKEPDRPALQPVSVEPDVSVIQAEKPLSKALHETLQESETQVQESRDLEPRNEEYKDEEATDEALAFVTKRPKKDKEGSKRSSRAPSESRATMSGVSDVLSIETRAENETPRPSEHLVSSPVALKDENLTKSDQHLERDTHEPTSDDERIDTFASDLSRTPSKKDKRKRQATVDINMNDDMNVPKPPLTSWADEVEEAEVERNIPVIQDIGKDESLSHIASTTEFTPFDDFFRPTKKGKKGKKKFSETTSSAESSRPPTGYEIPKDEPADEHSDIPILATASVALAGAALLSKGGETQESTSKSGTSTGAITPQRKLSKKEKKRKSIDRAPTPRDDIFDNPDLWEEAEPKPHEEVRHADDDTGSDGFGFATRDLDEPLSVHEPYEPRELTTGYEERSYAHTGTSAHVEEEKPISPIAEGKHTLEKYNSARDRETDSSPTNHYATTAEASQERRSLSSEEQQEHHYVSEEFDGSSSMSNRISQIPYEAYVPEETVQHREDAQSISQPHFPRPPRNFVGTPPSDKGISFEVPPPIIQEHISTPSRAPIEQPHTEKSVEFEDVIERSPARPPSTSKYGRTSFSDLPVVHEENPAQMESEQFPAHPFHDAEANRDSAFVTGSPVPRQRGFTDDHDEHVRDSGVHLRDFSPTEKARTHVSSTDDALARLSWPHVDEESETVDLQRSQRPIVESSAQQHHQERVLPETRDTHSHESHRPKGNKTTDSNRSQRSIEEKPKHYDETTASRDLFPSYKSTGDSSTKHLDEGTSRDHLPSQQNDEKHVDLHRVSTIHGHRKPKEDNIVKQRVQHFESPDLQRPQKPKEDKYAELASSQRPKAERPKGMSEMEGGAALAGTSLGFAAARKLSQEQRPPSAQSQRSSSNINRLRTPDPKRPDSVSSNRSGTPPLRRSDRKLSGDLRSLSQRSKPDLAKDAELAALASSAVAAAAVITANPTANEGRVRAKDMADVYDGFGEGRMGSPRSPTRPHSMRRRQSMQVLDLETKVEQLAAENRMLAEAKAQAEHTLASTSNASSSLVEKDAEIDSLKRTLDWLQNEVTRLTQVNEGLNSANVELGRQHNERYGALESQQVQATRELQEVRDAHDNLSAGMEGIVRNEVLSAVQDKDREIAQLRAELDAAKEQIREMQRQILASKADEIDFLTIRDEDYFDNACQLLCQHVQQWVLRFSKFSDMRACRLSSEINNDKTIDRLDNAILDGSDVDSYLADRIKRRDVFMSMTMNMVWEFIFTRYLFGMDREQRQKLKSLEKTLSEVGPAAAVHHWRATTLTLLSKREAFIQQREQDTQAVVHAIIETLSEILPPPSHLESQIEEQLTRVMKEAVDLSIEMRTQRAEYMMLPPLLPEYDANGDLASKVSFNAALMNERSGDTVSNEELEEQKAIVRVVLFPLVVKKGDDRGEGDEEIVVCPAQVLVAKPKKSVRVFSPGSVQGHSRISLQSSMPADYGDGSVI